MKSNLFLRVIILLWGLCCWSLAHAAPVEENHARTWADSNGRLLLEAFREPNIQTRFDKLDSLFFELVDVNYVSQFVMGKYWRQMTEEQKQTYRGIFNRYVLATYKTFPLDFAQNITYKVGNAIKEGNFTTVSTTVSVALDTQSEPQDFLLQFRLHYNQGKIQLVDIKLAESSLILSYRGKFYQQLAELEDEIEWFLEDFEVTTSSIEDANRQRQGQSEY